MLVSVLSMVLGIVYYMSETHINDAVSSLVARDYSNYDDYIDNPEKYVTDERPLEEVLAIGNLVYHNYNKQSAIEEIYINKSVLDDLSELEIQNLEKKVKDLTVDRYDYYFTWGFFEYAKSNAGAYVVVIMYEIIRNAMVKRGNTKETKK
jgi:hypothetical protein